MKECDKIKIKNILTSGVYGNYKDKTGHFNRNMLRLKFWQTHFPDLYQNIFNEYELYQQKYEKFAFTHFIDHVIFDAPIKNKKKYKGIVDFLKNATHSEVICKHYYFKFQKFFNEIVDFDTKSFLEVKYCYEHGYRSRPKCYCGKDLTFTVYTQGYHKFCSTQCQLKYNNSEKEPKLSSLTDDEVRKVINKIKPDRRNLTNEKFANVYLNVYNYSQNDPNLSNRERLFLFLNKKTSNYSICPYCKKYKKIFKSSVTGYTQTCGHLFCINASKNAQVTTKPNVLVSRTSNYQMYDGFIYVLYSPNHDMFKIGIATNPLTRLNELKKDIPDLIISYCWYVHEACIYERELHEHFKSKQIIFEETFDGYTEYFKLSESDVKYIKDYINERL